MLDTVAAALARVLVLAAEAGDGVGRADVVDAPGWLPALCMDVTDEARSRGTEPKTVDAGVAAVAVTLESPAGGFCGREASASLSSWASVISGPGTGAGVTAAEVAVVVTVAAVASVAGVTGDEAAGAAAASSTGAPLAAL